MRGLRPLIILFLLAMPLLSACTEMAQGVQKTGHLSKQMIADTKQSWKGLFTYAPPPPKAPNAPQTRYCYKTLTDLVCYDSPQPQLTSQLVGYQDGDAISWIQPGGGSLGVSESGAR